MRWERRGSVWDDNDARAYSYLEIKMRRIGAPMPLGGDDEFGDAALEVLKIESVEEGPWTWAFFPFGLEFKMWEAEHRRRLT
jgi:hypothetical protein